MSLVVCSNKEQDGATLRQEQSLASAWSFRNQLPSTMTIPENSQVALQSCKVNVDGRVVFSRNNHRFYQWFGQKLNLDGTTDPQIINSTSYPAITVLTNANESGQVIESSLDDFAERLQDRIRSTSYHPNTKEKALVSILRNASGLDFLGYKITFDQSVPTANAIPADNTFQQWFRDDAPDDVFSYTGGIFKRTETIEQDVCAGICKTLPMTLNNGSLVVNISGTNSNVNSSGVEWGVGLSRFVNTAESGYFAPSYNNWFDDANMGIQEKCYTDFGVGRNDSDELIVYHTAFDPDAQDGRGTRRYEVNYWLNAGSAFTDSARYAFQATDNFTKIGLFTSGEQLEARIYNASLDGGDAPIGWQTICKYQAGYDPSSYFKPINQSCWCLHPVLTIGRKTSNASCQMEIEEFTSVPLTDYDPTVSNKGGWFETLELVRPGTFRCQDLECDRTWSNPASATFGGYTQIGLNASDGTAHNHVLILEENNVYEPTQGANAKQLLGFNQSVLANPNTITGSQVIYQSSEAPSLSSSMAMFVRLNNFGQNVVNAHTGNRSKILAHLPRFDNSQSTGRLYFEPQNFVWLDLSNSAPMNINSFDLSFCYVNEQYATILTGQSIVCLYFRKKPKELM